MSDEREGIRAEGDWSDGEHGTYTGLFTSEMGTIRGGLVTDMPTTGRPVYNPPRVKGVVGATYPEDESGDYPEGSTWRPI